MNRLMWRIAAILLVGAVSSNPGASAEGAPMVPTIQCECDCGIVQSVSTSDTSYGKMGDNDLMNEHIYKERDDGTVSEGQSKAKDGLTYGKGTCKWIDGNIFDGDLLFGKPHGDGKMKYNDGRDYDGKFRHGLMHGKGILKWADGSVYDGEWFNDKRHGQGKMKYIDGTVYAGDWHMKYKDGREYVGEWYADKRHGKGIMKYKDGSEYIGDWMTDERHGKGKMKYKDGTEYDGDWLADKRHGLGNETSMWQLYRYQGGWSYGKKHGKGVEAYFWGFINECEVEYKNDQLVHESTSRLPLLFRFILDVNMLFRLIVGVIISGAGAVILYCLFRTHFGLVVLPYFWLWFILWVARRVGDILGTQQLIRTIFGM